MAEIFKGPLLKEVGSTYLSEDLRAPGGEVPLRGRVEAPVAGSLRVRLGRSG